MTKKIALHFLRGYGNYNGGDIAGFDHDHAEALIKQGFAKKAADQPQTATLAQLKIEGPELKVMVDQAVADLRREIEADMMARETALEEREANLAALGAKFDAKHEELSQRERALEARIAAMADDETVIVDADGVVIEAADVIEADREIVVEAAKPVKISGLPKQGK